VDLPTVVPRSSSRFTYVAILRYAHCTWVLPRSVSRLTHVYTFTLVLQRLVTLRFYLRLVTFTRYRFSFVLPAVYVLPLFTFVHVVSLPHTVTGLPFTAVPADVLVYLLLIYICVGWYAFDYDLPRLPVYPVTFAFVCYV